MTTNEIRRSAAQQARRTAVRARGTLLRAIDEAPASHPALVHLNEALEACARAEIELNTDWSPETP